VEKELSRLQRRRDQLNDTLVQTTDHVRLAALGVELHEVQTSLDDAEERWLALAEEAESRR
jgi:hypothetical protein